MVPKLRLKTQSKKAERVKAENQYFPYSTLIKRAMVEAYCPTLVELVFIFSHGIVINCLCKSRHLYI